MRGVHFKTVLATVLLVQALISSPTGLSDAKPNLRKREERRSGHPASEPQNE
ncbi:hypothetical protein OHS71_01820 [Streptomyces sp. NBC_00377]|uniref:hypothetical protein n=1 Tax=unclassified Streptomyces TaxID=2593676 RepID=UPI002E2447F2|nr:MULTISPECIES: hypothetical protein [unclassified Streptomyces]